MLHTRRRMVHPPRVKVKRTCCLSGDGLLIGPGLLQAYRCNRCLSFAWYFWMHRAHG
jgi:hypothetical protein